MPSRKLNINLIFVLLICFVASGCGNMTIVKRKHLPGFHVDRSSLRKTQKDNSMTTQHGKEVSNSENDDKAEQATISNDRQTVENQIASIEPFSPDITIKAKTDIIKPIDGLFSTTVGKTKQQRVASEFRRAVFGQEEDERPWNELAIVSLVMGIVGFALMLTAGILFFITKEQNNYGFIFIGAGIAVASAMITAGIALKKKKFKVKRGRGLAFGGLFSGVLSLAMLLIGLIVGIVMLIVEILS